MAGGDQPVDVLLAMATFDNSGEVGPEVLC
jgi:hypothetical protein